MKVHTYLEQNLYSFISTSASSTTQESPTQTSRLNPKKKLASRSRKQLRLHGLRHQTPASVSSDHQHHRRLTDSEHLNRHAAKTQPYATLLTPRLSTLHPIPSTHPQHNPPRSPPLDIPLLLSQLHLPQHARIAPSQQRRHSAMALHHVYNVALPQHNARNSLHSLWARETAVWW